MQVFLFNKKRKQIDSCRGNFVNASNIFQVQNSGILKQIFLKPLLRNCNGF